MPFLPSFSPFVLSFIPLAVNGERLEAKTNTTSLFRFFLLKLPEGDELVWDDGTVNPEPCLDQFTLVSKVRQQHRYYLYLFFSFEKSTDLVFPPPILLAAESGLGYVAGGARRLCCLGICPNAQRQGLPTTLCKYTFFLHFTFGILWFLTSSPVFFFS